MSCKHYENLQNQLGYTERVSISKNQAFTKTYPVLFTKGKHK